MWFRTFCLLTLTIYLEVHCYVPVPRIYRQVELALRHYSTNTDHNPIIHSLLNVLVHDKRAKAFVTDQAIEKSLEDVKKFNRKDEHVLRRLLYGTKILPSNKKLPTVLEESIESALNTFFTYPHVDDNQTFEIITRERKQF
ncbi:unnamed protein product [Adineta ricciae]|uniref:Uncharacterized protein n=1 Tax=Adineta ricciae TaxID=249248 RepID=A0A813MF92_ADIRI|nr:unnamed protein product [Adineta ricciae]CAF1179834.1 unnamed protein product [Adineta ricciae]